MVLASVQTVTGAKTFGSAGAVGKLIVAGTTSGTTIIDAAAVAGTTTMTLPGATTTLVGTDTVQTLSNKTLTATDLGTPDAGNLTNCLSYPASNLAPVTVGSIGIGVIELGHATDTTLARVSAGKIAVEGVNVLLAAAPLVSAHTATAGSAMKQTAGTLMTTAEAGALEFTTDGFFRTVDTTNGRTLDCNQNLYRMTADGSAIGPAIADFFPANSSFPTVLNAVYLLDFFAFFLKTTTASITWTVTNTQAYTYFIALAENSGGAGYASSTALNGSGPTPGTTAAAVFATPGTGLTTLTNQQSHIRCVAECGTAGNIRLRVTSGSGTVTPLRGSYYTARRIPTANTGIFAA